MIDDLIFNSFLACNAVLLSLNFHHLFTFNLVNKKKLKSKMILRKDSKS